MQDSDADALEDAGLHTLPTAPSQPEAEEGIVPQVHQILSVHLLPSRPSPP